MHHRIDPDGPTDIAPVCHLRDPLALQQGSDFGDIRRDDISKRRMNLFAETVTGVKIFSRSDRHARRILDPIHRLDILHRNRILQS